MASLIFFVANPAGLTSSSQVTSLVIVIVPLALTCGNLPISKTLINKNLQAEMSAREKHPHKEYKCVNG